MRERGVAGSTSRIGSVSNTTHYAIATTVMSFTRRARGAMLRLVRQRRLSLIVGVLLTAPAAWVEFSGYGFPWWAQGLALVGGATGIALLNTGIVGVGPDWID